MWLLFAILLSLSVTAGVPQQQARAHDTERKTDIRTVQAYLANYYADNMAYPSLNQMNDADWRSANLKDLDPNALKDPTGTQTKLSATPAQNLYAYTPQSSDKQPCDNILTECRTYTLTATLEAADEAYSVTPRD